MEDKINTPLPAVPPLPVPTGSMALGSRWACACVRRDRHGKIKAIKLHPMTTKSCRVCGSKQFIGKPSNARPHWRGASDVRYVNSCSSPRPVQAGVSLLRVATHDAAHVDLCSPHTS